MISKRAGVRPSIAAFTMVAAVHALAVPRGAAAELPAAGPVSAESEPRCHRDEDLACTVVRETPAGVWVWTERYRPAAPGNSGWSVAVGGGPISPQPSVRFVASTPPGAPTPNGAPILE